MSARRMAASAALLLALLGAPVGPAAAQEPAVPAFDAGLDHAQVEFVRASQGADGLWCLAVTVRHRDEGWEHYADAWEALDPAGERITERVLAHPHVEEQPFTRQQCGVAVSAEVGRLRVRARCNRHGFGGREIVVDLGRAAGEGFAVTRAGGAER